MSESEDTFDNIGKITIELDDLYKSDPTLDSIKRLEKDKKALLGVNDLLATWNEPSVKNRLKDMQEALGDPKLEDAFKSHEAYMSIANPLLSAIKADNPQLLLEAFKLDIEPYLDSTYAQTLKATDLFSETLVNVSHLNLPKIPDYLKDMKETMSLYETSLGLGNKSLVELATNLENEAFKSKFGLVNNMGSVSEALTSSISALDSINLKAVKTMETFQSVKDPWLEQLNKSQESLKSKFEFVNNMSGVSEVLTSSTSALNSIGLQSVKGPQIKELELHKIPDFKLPRPEDSPHYKQNEKILKNSEEQIVLLNQVSVYMSSQSEKLEFLNKMTAQQVRDNKIATEKQMEENRIAAEKEMAINAKSSRLATWIAISGIFLTLVVSIISIWTTLYIYELEAISNNKDHSEVVKLLKENNPNKSMSKLVKQLKIQNKNFNELKYIKKENEKMKAILESQKLK